MECRGVERQVLSPTRLAQLSSATGIGSQRSGTSHSRNSNSLISQGRIHLSPSLPTPFRPSREGSDQPPASQRVDEFPSQSLKVKQILPKLSSANKNSVPVSGSKCRVRSPHVGSSRLESEPTPSEKTRPAMSVANYNQTKSSWPGSVYSLKVSF